MAESRSYRAKKNILYGVINKLIALGFPFIIRTILIKQLGADYLGLGSLFTSILQVLSLAELGFSSAIVFSLYKPLADNDKDEVCALMAFYRFVYRLVGIVILVGGLIVLPFLPRFIKGDYPADINLFLLYSIFLLNTVISYLMFAYKSALLTASQRQDVISNIDSVLTVIRSVIQIIVLFVVCNYYIYILLNTLFTIVNNIVIAIITKKSFPQYVCYGKLRHERKKKIIKQIQGLLIGKISLTARNSFDSVILSMFCGLIPLAIYSNYYYIFSAVIGIIGIVIQSLIASIGNSVAIETVEKNYRDFKRFNYVFSWIGSWCTVCLCCLYQPFMKIWVGEDLLASNKIMLLFCTYFYITQMGQVRSMYSTAAGIWWELRYLGLVEMVVNLVLNIGLGYVWGIYGILWATIISVFLFSIIGITCITFKVYFKKRATEYFQDSVLYAIITVFTTVITYLICGLFNQNKWFDFLIKTCICIIVPNIIYFVFTVIDENRKNYLISVLNNFFTEN